MQERRRNPRFQVRVPVQVARGAERFEARLKDLCRDAVLVEVAVPVALGSELALALELPGTGGPLQVVGSVVREAPGEDGLRDVAVLFADLNPAAETRIDFFIALQGQDA